LILQTKSDISYDYSSAHGGIQLLPGDQVEYFLEEDKSAGSTWAVSLRLCGPLVGTVKERASASRPLYKVTIHPDQRQILVLFSNQTAAPKQDLEISMFWDFNMEEYVAKDVKKLSALPAVPKRAQQKQKEADSSSDSSSASPSEPLSPVLQSSSGTASLRSSSSSMGATQRHPSSQPLSPTLAPISPPISLGLQETARPILGQLVAKLVPTGATRITEILLESHKSDDEILRLVQDPHYLTYHTTEAMKIYESELRRQISAAEILASASMNSQRSTSAPANLFNLSSFPPAMQSIAAQMLAQQAAQAGVPPETLMKSLIMQNLQMPQQQTRSAPTTAPPNLLGGLPGIVPTFQQASQPMGSGLFGFSGPSFSPLLFQQAPHQPVASDDIAPAAPLADVPQKIDQEFSYYPQRLLHQSSISKTYEGIRRTRATSQRVCVRVYEPGLIEEDAVPEMIHFSKQHQALPEFLSEPLAIGKSVAVAMHWYPTTLRMYLEDHKKSLTFDKRRDIALQLMLAVEILHINDRVCRDINPDCIFMQDDRVILSDFGLPSISNQSGLSIYSAPEIAGGRIGPAQDMFALGCCFGHILGGHHPLVDLSNGGTIAEHLLSGTMPGLASLEQTSPLAYDLISVLINADDDVRPSILAVSEHMFFWSAAQIEALVNRIFLLVSRDPGFDEMLVEASADVIPVGDAGDFSWRTHFDEVLLAHIDSKLEKEGVDIDDSLVGLIFAFKAALDSADTWPSILRHRFKVQDSRQSLCSYFVDLFPKMFAIIQKKAEERKTQLMELLPLFELGSVGEL
jgi:serine/threonine protein kinase